MSASRTLGGTHPIHRSILSHWLWSDRPFAFGQAFIDLILLANFRDEWIFLKGEQYLVKKGQILRSQLTLTKRWDWSRGKVSRFLKYLQEDGMISLQTDQRASVITLLNYERLHTCAFENRTASGAMAVQLEPENGASGIHQNKQLTGQRFTRRIAKNETSNEAANSASDEALSIEKRGTKEEVNNKTRVNPNAAVKDFIDWWIPYYEQRFGKKYILSKGKDSGIVQGLLGEISFEELKTRAMMFFSSKDTFAVDRGHDLLAFRSMINKFGNQRRPETVGQRYEAIYGTK